METAPHRIRRYRWVVRASAPDEGFAIRKRLRDEWGEELLSALARAFDEAGTGERIVRIPKIELNLRVASEAEFVTLLPELIYQQLGRQLRTMLNAAGEPARESGRREELTPAEDRFAMVVHYLRRGALPWRHSGITSVEIIDALRTVSHHDLPRLVKVLGNERDSLPWLYRLLQVQEESELPDFVRALIKAVVPTETTGAGQVLAAVIQSYQVSVSHHVRLRLIAVLLVGIMPGAGSGAGFISDAVMSQLLTSDERAALQAILSALPGKITNSSTTLMAQKGVVGRSDSDSTGHGDMETASAAHTDDGVLKERNVSPAIPPDTSLEGTRVVRDEHTGVTDNEGVVTGSEAAGSMSRHQQIVRSDRSPEELISSHDDRSPTSDESGGFAIRVWNAGLVLLHPFMSALFANRGLIEPGSMELPGSSLARAAALLHFMATGREEIYEYELGLCKVLLGLTPDLPLLVAEGLLHRDDMEEADTLLRSATGHWSVLKTTSVEGMRQSFLQRSGLIRKEDDGWRLLVEPESFDLLLKYLPWGISIIKLPWMKQPMHIEWATP